jgi:hypothetical protein
VKYIILETIFSKSIEAYGIDDASSAMEAATVITNRQGISQPKIMPT